MYRIKGWLTIWTPIIISIRADDYPAAIGKRLEIGFGNKGESDSVAAIDTVRLEINDRFHVG